PFSHYSSLLLRALPSFPTRRSSDLSIFLTLRQPSTVAWCDRSAAHTSSSWHCTPSKPSFLYSRILAAKATSSRTGGPNGSAPVLDRKSTRLNSSHRTISYAVFCLKK